MDANEPRHHKWPVVRNREEALGTVARDFDEDLMTPSDDGVYGDA
jgi:hypothetical protein